MIGPGWEIGYQNAEAFAKAKTINVGGVTLLDNSEAVEAQLDANMARALQAVGVEAVGMIRDQMETGYKDVHPAPGSRGDKAEPPNKKPPHTAIRDTSALINNVQFEVKNTRDGPRVEVGNTLEYALFVHDGTRFLNKRPYIRDAISKGWPRLQEVWTQCLKPGFD